MIQYLDQAHEIQSLFQKIYLLFLTGSLLHRVNRFLFWDRYHDHDQASKAYGTVLNMVIRLLKWLVQKENSNQAAQPALIIEGARMTARLRYAQCFQYNVPSDHV